MTDPRYPQQTPPPQPQPGGPGHPPHHHAARQGPQPGYQQMSPYSYIPGVASGYGNSGPVGGWGDPSQLRQTPVGQAGALHGSSWQQAAMKRVGFGRLVFAEIQKLFATVSDRILMILAPLLFIGLTVTFSYIYITGAFAEQIAPAMLSAHLGLCLFNATTIKVVSGEWHYRSAQLSLLLQPRRAKYIAAQLTAVGLFWLLYSLLLFGVFVLARPAALSGMDSDSYIAERWLDVLAVCLLAVFLSVFLAYSFGLLIRNSTAAVIAYFVALIPLVYLLSPQIPVLIEAFSPYAPFTYMSINGVPAFSVFSGGAMFLLFVTFGAVVACRRDAV